MSTLVTIPIFSYLYLLGFEGDPPSPPDFFVVNSTLYFFLNFDQFTSPHLDPSDEIPFSLSVNQPGPPSNRGLLNLRWASFRSFSLVPPFIFRLRPSLPTYTRNLPKFVPYRNIHDTNTLPVKYHEWCMVITVSRETFKVVVLFKHKNLPVRPTSNLEPNLPRPHLRPTGHPETIYEQNRNLLLHKHVNKSLRVLSEDPEGLKEK